MSDVASMSAVARRFLFVREQGGANHGFFVNFFQRKGGDGVEGDSWCSDFASIVEDIAYKGRIKSPRTGSTRVKLDYCRKQNWVVTVPQVDDLFFYVHDDGTPHHVGIVSATTPLTGIAGNTSEDGTSSNGDGVYEHAIGGHIIFVRLPK